MQGPLLAVAEQVHRDLASRIVSGARGDGAAVAYGQIMLAAADQSDPLSALQNIGVGLDHERMNADYVSGVFDNPLEGSLAQEIVAIKAAQGDPGDPAQLAGRLANIMRRIARTERAPARPRPPSALVAVAQDAPHQLLAAAAGQAAIQRADARGLRRIPVPAALASARARLLAAAAAESDQTLILARGAAAGNPGPAAIDTDLLDS